MKAIILAAGRGSRMKNLTDDKPKCLVELKGKALLDWQVEAIRKAGIDEIGIVTGYKRELLISRGLKEFHNERWAETQMVSSLACASEWLEKDQCIISYSDIFYRPSAIELLKECKEDIGITYDKNWLQQWSSRFSDPLSDAETFNYDENNHLIEIGNKPTSYSEINGQYMGLITIKPEGWRKIIELINSVKEINLDFVHVTKLLEELIRRKKMKIEVKEYSEEWGEVDSETDLKFFKSRN